MHLYGVHIFHAHYVLYYKIHSKFNIQIQYSSLCKPVILKAYIKIRDSTYKVNIHSDEVTHSSCALCFMTYIT